MSAGASEITVGQSVVLRATTPGDTFVWEFPDGTKKQGQTVSHSFAKAGQFQITLKASNRAGERNQRTKTITVLNADKPTALIRLRLNGNERFEDRLEITTQDRVTIESASLSGTKAAQGLSGHWMLNGREVVLAQIPQFLRTPGTYEVTLWIGNEGQGETGGSQTTRTIVVRNQAPQIGGITWLESNRLPGQFQVRVRATDPDGQIENYVFQALVNNQVVTTQSSLEPQTFLDLSQRPGETNYFLRVTATDDLGETTVYDHSVPVRVIGRENVDNQEPELEIKLHPGNQGLLGTTFTLKAEATDVDGDNLRYQWTFPSGKKYYTPSVSFTPEAIGDYEFLVEVGDGLNLIKIQETIFVRDKLELGNSEIFSQISQVSPGLEGDINTVFRFSPLTESEGREGRSYVWSMGDGQTMAVKSPAYQYARPGTYTVTLTTTNTLGQSGTDMVELKVSRAGEGPEIETAKPFEETSSAIPLVARITAPVSPANLGEQLLRLQTLADQCVAQTAQESSDQQVYLTALGTKLEAELSTWYASNSTSFIEPFPQAKMLSLWRLLEALSEPETTVEIVSKKWRNEIISGHRTYFEDLVVSLETQKRLVTDFQEIFAYDQAIRNAQLQLTAGFTAVGQAELYQSTLIKAFQEARVREKTVDLEISAKHQQLWQWKTLNELDLEAASGYSEVKQVLLAEKLLAQKQALVASSDKVVVQDLQAEIGQLETWLKPTETQKPLTWERASILNDQLFYQAKVTQDEVAYPQTQADRTLLDKVDGSGLSGDLTLETVQGYLTNRLESKTAREKLTSSQREFLESTVQILDHLSNLGLEKTDSLGLAHRVMGQQKQHWIAGYFGAESQEEKQHFYRRLKTLERWRKVLTTLHDPIFLQQSLTELASSYPDQKAELLELEIRLRDWLIQRQNRGLTQGYEELSMLIQKVEDATTQTRYQNLLDQIDLPALETSSACRSVDWSEVLAELTIRPGTNLFLYGEAPADFDQSLFFRWDFDNGQSKIGQNVQTSYYEPGLYRISLMLTSPNQVSQDDLWVRVVAD